MKQQFYGGKTIRLIVLLLLTIQAARFDAMAQCGNASFYRPSASTTIACSGSQVYLYATGLPVTNWIYRDNGTGNWNTFSFNTDNANQYVYTATTTVRTYRAVVSTLSCPTDTTLGIDVTITPATYGINNNIRLSASATQVCSGSQITIRRMNQGVQSVVWMYRDNGGSWNIYSYNNSDASTNSMPYTQTPLTREFRVVTKSNNSCQQDSSAILSVNVSPVTSGQNPNIAPVSNQNAICGGTSVTLQADWPFDVGNWIYKDAGSATWQVLSSTNTTAYDFNTSVPASTTREYKVVLLNPTNCTADTSASVFVNINASIQRTLTSIMPRINGGTTQICAGNSVSFQIPGYSNIQSWIYRDSSNGTWTYFSSSSSPSLSSSSNITKDLNRKVKVVINNSANTCSIDTSAEIGYLIKANVKGNTTTVPFASNPEICIGAQATIYLQNGQTVNNWIYRNNNTGSWQNGFSSGNTYYDYNTTFTVNTLRSYKAIINNSTSCRIDTSAEVQVLYKVPVPGGIVALTPTINQQAYCAGSTVSGNISISSNSRQVSKWIYRDNNTGVWNDLSFQNSTYFSDYNTTVLAPTIRTYKVLIKNLETFTVDSSMEVSVDLNPVTRGTTGIAPTSALNHICNDNSISLNVVPPTGYSVYYWIYRDTINQNWNLFSSGSTTTSNYVSTTKPNRAFRVILLNNAICRYDTTNALVVTVDKKTGRNNASYQPVASTPAVCGNTSYSVSISLPSGTNVSKWIYRDNGSAWKETFSSSTNYFESSSNTRVLVATAREYKVVINDNNNCYTDTSAGVIVNISPLTNGVISGITPTTSASLVCAGSNYSANISYSGTVQKWVYRDNGASWREFENNTASTYLYENNTFVPTLTNREYRAYLLRPNTCIVDTTQVLNVQIKPFTYGTASALQPAASAPNVCSGSTFSVNINSGTGYDAHKWIFRDNNTGGWREISNYSASTYFTESNSSVTANTLRSYKAIIQTNTCGYDTTAEVSVQLNARTYGYANAVTLTSSNGVYCSAATINTNVITSTMPSGSNVRRWLYMDNMSGNWLAVPNSQTTYLGHSFTYVTVPTSRSYRTIINNTTTCSYDSSGIFSVSINPSGYGYATTITPTISQATVCNASTNPYLNVTLPSGYTVLKWVVNNNGTGWTDFGYNTVSSGIYDYNTAVQVPVSRSYRAILSNSNTCSIDSSNTVSASINPAMRGVLNTVTPTSTRTNYCYTKTVTASVSTPSGYTIEKWIYNDNNTGIWSEFPFSTSSSLNDNNTYVSVSTSRSYRVIMFNNSTCQRDTTAALTVVLNPRTSNIGARAVQPTATPVAGICSGSNVSLSVVPGTGNEVWRWTYSDNGTSGPWYDALNSYSSSSFNHSVTQTNIALTRLYRAIITDTATCDFDSTLAVAMIIKPITYGNDTAMTISGLDTVCVGSTVSVSISPGSGNSVNKWIYSDNGGVWKNFTSSTASNFLNDGNTQLAPGSVRGYTPLVFKSAVCRIDTLAKVKTVYFKQKTYGTGTATVNISVDTVCAGNNVSMSTSGSTEKWMYRDGNSGPWTAINSSSSSFYTHYEIGVTSSVWRYYRALISGGACNADTSNADSIYLKVQTYGNTAFTPTSSSGSTICAGNSVSINLAFISGANMQRWLYKDNSTGPWIILSTSSSFSITDYNTSVTSAVTRTYRAIIFRNCSYDTTAALTVTITPKGKGTDVTKVPTATSTSVCAASPVQNIQVNAGSGNTISQWLYRNNGGAWQVLAYGNQNYLTDYNTLTGASITRGYAAIINNNTTCSFDTSAVLNVTINPVVLGNSSRTVAASATACMNNNYSVSLNVASDTSVIRFLYNTNGSAWMDRGYINPASNVSITEYAYNGIPYTMGYRAIMYKAGNCHIDTTAPVIVSVIPRTYGNDNGIIPTGSATACSGSSFNVNVSAGSGNTVSQWLYSDDGMSWNVLYTSSTNISQQVYTASPITRQYRALIVKANSCSIDTTAAKSVMITPLVYSTDSTSQVTIASGKPGCTGTPVSITTNAGGNSVNNWLYSDNNGAWNNMYYGGTSITDYNTGTSTSIDRVYAAVIWKQATCHMDTTYLNDTVNISPRMYGNDNSINVFPSVSSACIGSAIGLTATTGSHSVERWYYRDNGGVWNVLNNSTSSSITDYNTYVTASTTREYRALIRKSNVCAFDTSATASVTISPRTVGTDNSIIPQTTNSNVCSGSYATISVNTGSGNSIQKWIYSQNGGAWMDFAYTSSSSVTDYSTSVSSTTVRQYRAIIVKGSGCSIDTTAAVTVTFNPIGFGNQNTVIPSASKNAICAGSGVTLSVSGFSGSSVLRWLYRDQPADAWTEVYTSSTVYSDFNTNILSTITRQYRAVINNNTGCSTDTTAAASVSISPITNGTVATPTQVSQPTVCSGSPVNVFINPAAGRTVNSWLYRENGGSWMLFSTSTATSINDFNTSVSANTTREYKAILNNAAGCSLDSAQAITANINIITAGSNLSIVPNTSTPTLCSGNTAIVSVSGFSGNVVTWLFRDSVTDGWSNTFNANFTLFHTSTFVSYSRTRQYRAIVYNANNCSNDTTAAVQLQINPQLAGNANSVLPTTPDNTICSGTSISLNATGFINGGIVTGWVYNDNGGAWILISGAAGASYTHTNTAVTGLTTRNYRALVFTGCSTDTTAAVIVTLDQYPTKPVISNTAGTDSLVCSETADSYTWKLNGNPITGANGKVHIATENGSYTIEIGNATGCKTSSDAFVYNHTGITDVFANVKLSVYPNPTHDGQVTIDWTGLSSDKVKVIIMDMLGRIVETEELVVTGTNGATVDLSAQQPGVYFITISAEESSVTRKILYSK